MLKLKKISVSKIYSAFDVIQKVSQRFINPVEFAISYPLAKNLIAFEQELKVLNAERQKLIDKFAEKDEEGKVVMLSPVSVKIKDELLEEFNKEYSAFLEREVELYISTISIEEAKKSSEAKFTIAEQVLLDFMFEE